MKIEKIEHLDFLKLQEILSSTRITDSEKIRFIEQNKPEIEKIVDVKISNEDFNYLIQNRNLVKFRPLKNSFTKKGDKILLAKALNINPSEVSSYIKNVSDSIQKLDKIDFLSEDKVEMLKTYVYRHGSKDELVNFLDYELTKSKDTLKSLYKTLTYHSGGIADYFIRPIHRMDDKTLIKIFKIINKHIKQAFRDGNITDAESKKIAKWTLIRIYRIQNNSKLINAIKTYKTLS